MPSFANVLSRSTWIMVRSHHLAQPVVSTSHPCRCSELTVIGPVQTCANNAGDLVQTQLHSYAIGTAVSNETYLTFWNSSLSTVGIVA
jgi:hypothetical protein